MSEIPKDFLAEEIRCGYRITERQKRIWKVELDLLEAFQSICAAHDLRYWAFGGTLLGAVRHQGYIPWDDDIDIVMPRPDYERFLSVAQEEIRPPYFLQTPITDPGYFRFAFRLRNSETTGVCLDTRYLPINQGIFLDVFPLDGCERSRLSQRIKWLRLKRIHVCANASVRSVAYRTFKHKALYSVLKPLYKAGILRFNRIRNYEKVQKIAASADWENARQVVMNASFAYKLDQYIYDKQDFSDTETMDFEYLKIAVPRGYEHVLQKNYGDYMQLPPPDKRGNWHAEIVFEPDIPYRQYCSGHFGVVYDD